MADLVYRLGRGVNFRVPVSSVIDFQIEGRALQGQVRNALGQFQSIQKVFAPVHREAGRIVAEKMQDALNEQIQAHLGPGYGDTDRPRGVSIYHEKGGGGRKTSQERLVMVLNDDRNILADGTRFAVGIEEWLDESPARKYWKRLEYGGANPSILYTFSAQMGPRFARLQTRGRVRVAKATIPEYSFLRTGAARGVRQVRKDIGEMYREAGIKIGVDIKVGAARGQ